MNWQPSSIAPAVTAPTVILVAEPGWRDAGGNVEEPVLIGLYQAFPDGRIESELTGMPPHIATWYWTFERDVLRDIPTLRS